MTHVHLRIFILVFFSVILSPIFFVVFLFSFLFSFIPIYSTKIAKKNLTQRMCLSGLKLHIAIAKIYLNYFFYFLEVIFFHPLRLTVCTSYTIHDSAQTILELEKIYPEAQDRGFALITLHMGNYEVSALPLLESKKFTAQSKIYAIAKPTRSKIINSFSLFYRKRKNFNIIWADRHLMINLIRALKSRGSIAILADQKPQGNTGHFFNFFESQAEFPISGLRVCIENKLKIVYASCHRVLPGWIKLKTQVGLNAHLNGPKKHQNFLTDATHLTPTEVSAQKKISEKNNAAVKEMSYYVAWIEKEIRSNYTQWSWDYDKWSRSEK